MPDPDKFPIAVLASGRGSNFQALIDACKNGSLPAQIILLVTDNAKAIAIERAQKAGIEHRVITRADYKNREEFDSAIADAVGKSRAELVCLAGFMRILSPLFLTRFPGMVINIHPSLLPEFPGLDVQKRAIEAGAKVSGCTVHFVDEGVDTGPIIAQRKVEVMKDDTVETLSARILEEEHKLYPEAIRMVMSGEAMTDRSPALSKGEKQ